MYDAKEVLISMQDLSDKNETLKKENEELKCKLAELNEKFKTPLNDKNREIEELKAVIKTLSKLI